MWLVNIYTRWNSPIYSIKKIYKKISPTSNFIADAKDESC